MTDTNASGRPAPSAGPFDTDNLPSPTKRPRRAEQSAADTTEDTTSSPRHLTADLWALVMPYLPYLDNLRCTAVNRSFLHDVAPMVKGIMVMSSAEMKVKPARRFSGVEDVKVACLYHRRRIMHEGDRYGEWDEEGFDEYEREDDEEDVVLEVDRSTVTMAVPFLSSFPSLEEVSLGRYRDLYFEEASFDDFDYAEYDYSHRFLTEEDNEMLRGLHAALCGAYRSRLIPSETVVWGIKVPCRTAEDDEEVYCAQCVDSIQCFPVEVVAIGIGRGRYGCVPPKTAVDMYLRRPGSIEHLSSAMCFLKVIFDFEEPARNEFVAALKERDLVPTISPQDAMRFFKRRNGRWGKKIFISERDLRTARENFVPLVHSDIRRSKLSLS